MSRMLIVLLAWVSFASAEVVNPAADEAASGKQKPLVVASIPPLAMLVKEVAGDSVEVRTLVKDGQSPHHFQLSPAQRQDLDRASMLVWVGPEMEPQLAELAEKVNDHLPVGAGYKRDNKHVWLDPYFVPVLSAIITNRFRIVYPFYSVEYRERHEKFYARWQEQEKTWNNQLSGFNTVNFVTDHDNWQHFLAHYKLNKPFVLSDHHGEAPGAKKRAELEAWLKEKGAACYLLEPGGQDKLASQLGGVKVVKLDPLGGGAKDFMAFQQSLVDAIKSCK